MLTECYNRRKMKRQVRKLLMLCGSICLLQGTARAQDIHFSQFYENAILRNPALTGIFSGDYKAGVNFRNQWSSLAVPFVTVLASAETRIPVNREVGDYLSFGLTASYDKAGSINFTSMQVYPAINYNKALEDAHLSYLSVGFAGGYIQRSVDMSKMTFSNQWTNGGYDPGNASGENITFAKLQHFDLSAGISFNSSIGEDNRVNYYFGGAAYHFTKPKETFDPNESFVRLSTRWTGNLGVQSYITENIGLTVHLNYQNQTPYQEFIGGGLLSWRSYDAAQQLKFSIYAGCFYRVKDAVIPTVKVDYNEYSFTASYDVTTSSLRPAAQGVGGFEFSLYVRGKFNTEDPMRQSRCPRFENMIPGFME